MILSVNKKDGCSVMINQNMFSNIALYPIIIFTDIFGKTLMKRYNNMKKPLFYYQNSMDDKSNQYITF